MTYIQDENFNRVDLGDYIKNVRPESMGRKWGVKAFGADLGRGSLYEARSWIKEASSFILASFSSLMM